MKKCFICLFILTSFCSNGQLPRVGNAVTYEEVVSIDSVLRTDLYYRAKKFLVDNFYNTKPGTQIDNKEDGLIVATGRALLLPKSLMSPEMLYTLEISLKDGKYKYRLYNIRTQYWYNGKPLGENPAENLDYNNKKAKKLIDAIDTEAISTITKLKAAMLIKSPTQW